MMDQSENACVENLRPKNIPDGLIALGTVVQISEIQIKLQITGGIICLVDRANVSQAFTNSLVEYGSKSNARCEKPPRLGQIFKRGQQYVCKVIERRPRKGYADAQDIIATLDPSSIQEDALPKTLLAIPQVPLQCAVQSVEDHGYQLDIGFKGLRGFLSFDEAEYYCAKQNDGKKLYVGQVVICYLLEPFDTTNNECRVVQLTLSKESKKNSKFSKEKVTGHLLNERCILPGSQSFLTVMKVKKEGLIVNFMNEFAGFVSVNHLKEIWHTTKENYKIADQMECSVLYYNPTTKIFALSVRKNSIYKKTIKHFLTNYHQGQIIPKAKVAYLEGTRSVVFKVDKTYKAVANVRDALEEDVATMTRDDLHLALDSAFPDASTHKCRIKSINLTDQILVLSLRQEFLDLPYVSVEELKPADVIEATVKKYVQDGIVVTFGLNLIAIILNGDLHDYVSAKSYKRYPVGKSIKCRVLKVDFTKQPARVYLTNKEQLMNPELIVVDSFDKSFQGKSTYATIRKINPLGLIVELFNNVKGFIPKRFLSKVPISNMGDLFKIGQVIPCSIYKVDQANQSLKLGVISFEEISKTLREKKKKKKEIKELKKLAKIERKIDEDIKQKSKTATKRDISQVDETIPTIPPIKSRRQRSEEAKLREEELRQAEAKLLDPDRQPNSIADFERLILKTPNSAAIWIKYTNFFLENIETEKARIISRRALQTINYRLEAEKLKVWLNLIRLETKYGGIEKTRETIHEAAQTTDKLSLYRGAIRVLISCGELDEAERMHELLLKSNAQSPEVWIDYLLFYMEHRKDFEKARSLFDKACKILKSDLVYLKSRFAQFEFRFGEVERGKTMFENLLSDNPKRTDLWKVYESMIKKFGTKQVDTEEAREQNEQTLQRIAESIELISKKGKKKTNLSEQKLVQV